MCFVESEYLLHNGVAGQAVVEAVDAFLGARNRDSLFDEDLVVVSTRQPRLSVRAALAAYVEHGVLDATRMVRCAEPTCRTLTPANRVEQARKDGDEEPCDGPCRQDLAALADPDVVDAYKLVAMPVRVP
jgi:hypothetical protein